VLNDAARVTELAWFAWEKAVAQNNQATNAYFAAATAFQKANEALCVELEQIRSSLQIIEGGLGRPDPVGEE
jgi:hypothetical protein